MRSFLANDILACLIVGVLGGVICLALGLATVVGAAAQESCILMLFSICPCIRGNVACISIPLQGSYPFL